MGRRRRGVGKRRYVSCFQLIIDSSGENRWCLCSLQEGSNGAVLVAKIEASICSLCEFLGHMGTNDLLFSRDAEFVKQAFPPAAHRVPNTSWRTQNRFCVLRSGDLPQYSVLPHVSSDASIPGIPAHVLTTLSHFNLRMILLHTRRRARPELQLAE
jgi:hypothetical protein